MIDENRLKEIVSYSCDTDGSKEAERWKEWFLKVIDAEVNREHEQDRHNMDIKTILETNPKPTMRHISEGFEKKDYIILTIFTIVGLILLALVR